MFENTRHPIIGMLHLRPLPGSPRSDGNLDGVRQAMLHDADALAEGGVHGLMLENFGDVPFHPARVPEYVVACMTALAMDVRRRFALPLGINVLRNDGCAALAVAQACGAQFIRVNVLCGARVADQGIIQGIAHDLLRLRATLKSDVKILADVDVKHSSPLAARSIQDEVSDTLHRGLADALIASGSGTGKPTNSDHLRQIKAAAGAARVFVGSGANADTIEHYLHHCDGFIIGSAFKSNGDAEQPVEMSRVRQMLSKVKQ